MLAHYPGTSAGINAGIQRFAATPDAVKHFNHYYEPSGDLRMPMLMLSNSRDRLAPAFHRDSYENAVAVNGSSTCSSGTRSIDTATACSHQPSSGRQSDLVVWVEFGIEPAP